MVNTTKKQHYIWKKYLKKWVISDVEEKLYVLRKQIHGKQAAIEYRKLDDIGFEKYFYDMSGFSKESINILIQLLKHMQNKQSYQFLIDNDMLKDAATQRDFIEKNVMCINEDIDNKYNFLDKLVNKNFSFYEDSKSQTILNRFQMLLHESLLGTDIMLSDDELKSMLNDFFKSLSDEDLKYEFNQFFWMQYFRSPSVIKRLKASITKVKAQRVEFKNLDEKFFANMYAIYCAAQIALNLTQHFATNIYLLENNTNVPFVTSDTPIINMTGIESLETSQKFLFYYPISPKIAIQLIVMLKTNFLAMQSKNCINSIGQNEVQIVKDLNIIQALECNNEIYSNDRNHLETIKNEIEKILHKGD